MKDILTSVMLPSRGRAAALRRSIDSLRSTRRHPMEVLVALDDDDSDSIRSLLVEPIEDLRFIVMPRVGYRNLHHYVNRLALSARGQWLFLWNDDCVMETEGWDDILRDRGSEFVFLNPGSNHENHANGCMIFPIVPRSYVTALGWFSRSNHNDTYVEKIANNLGLRVDVAIYVRHDRADLTGANNDDVYAERVLVPEEFYGEEVQAMIVEDTERLRKYIEAN